MNKAELIRHEIEKRREHNLAIGNPLFAAMAEEDIELLCFINSLQEEPVSEDLEEAADSYIKTHGEILGFGRQTFKAGAEWQKEWFEKNRLKHCNNITNVQVELEQGFIDQHLDRYNRMPTFLDAIEYGIKWQKERERSNSGD